MLIKTENLVPSVYYKHSRDFQVLGRAYDIIFNYIKSNTDTIHNLPLSSKSDRRLLELMCSTLGFKIKHTYNEQQLYAICTMFTTLIKNKGTLKAVEDTVNILLEVDNIEEPAEVVLSEDNTSVDIYLPAEINLTLLYDLFDYIMPAGISYNIYISRQIEGLEGKTVIASMDTIIKAENIPSRSSEHSIIKGALATGEVVSPATLMPGMMDNSTIVPYEND